MNIQHELPSVHWIWNGSIGYVYEVHPGIVAKVLSRPDDEEEAQHNKNNFAKELAIYRKSGQNQPCPFIVQWYHLTDNCIFLEYMRHMSLSSRIQDNQIKFELTQLVIGLHKLEPLPLRLEWMDHLTQAVAFLESLNLAHGDLRPENILLDNDRLKLCDFDNTEEIGTELEAVATSDGRDLNSNETDQGEPGTPGRLGARTEQFALGCLFYYINHGYELYRDRWLTEDHREHNIAVRDRLQNMIFPELNDSEIDNIIDRCWHNKYIKISDLATHVASLRAKETGEVSQPDGSECDDDYILKKTLCQEMEKNGLISKLSSGSPEELGFECEFYRYAY